MCFAKESIPLVGIAGFDVEPVAHPLAGGSFLPKAGSILRGAHGPINVMVDENESGA